MILIQIEKIDNMTQFRSILTHRHNYHSSGKRWRWIARTEMQNWFTKPYKYYGWQGE
jgi:hypothetical protein